MIFVDGDLRWTVFQNSAGFLVEWIEWYRLLGVQHFFLYDHESQVGQLLVFTL